MKLVKSVCTTVFFPDSRKNADAFQNMARYLSEKGMDCIEFYYDDGNRDRIGAILQETGLDGVYIAVIPSKEKKLYLCDEDEAGRLQAVELFQGCIDEAAAGGVSNVMINSGRIGNNIENGLESLAKSVEALYDYSARKNYHLNLLMEPCDSHMEAFHLIGPWQRTLAFVKRMHQAGLPLQLTMDSAHTSEEGENFLEAVTGVKQYCNRIHFANCFIQDPNNPFYGDKHLGYEYPDTEWTVPALSALFDGLEKLYPGNEPLQIGLEVLCRAQDPFAYFEKTWNRLKFLQNI